MYNPEPPGTSKIILIMLLTILAVAVVSVLIFQWAWNFVIVGLFGVPELTFWQTVAVGALVWIVGGWLGPGFRNNNYRN